MGDDFSRGGRGGGWGITGSDTLPPLLMDAKGDKKSPRGDTGGGGGGEMIIMIYRAYWVLYFPGENT